MSTQQEAPPVREADARGAGPESTGGLVQQAVDQGSRLIATEVQLAKQELQESVRAGVVAVIAGAVAVFGLIAFLVMAVVTIVAAVTLHWAAALGFAVAFLVLAGAGAGVAIGRLKRISPLRQTTETLKEDVAWVKQQLTRGGR